MMEIVIYYLKTALNNPLSEKYASNLEYMYTYVYMEFISI